MGASLELKVHALAAGGDGVALHPDGRVVFVPFAAVGDRVRVELVEERRRFARGRVDALLEAGPDRVEPVCPLFGRCGGCSWQHLRYEAQVQAKRRILRDALERIARIAPPDPVGFVASPEPYGYRQRTRVVWDGERAGYRERRSHACVAIDSCPVLAPPLARAVLDPSTFGPRAQRSSGTPQEWELTCNRDGQVIAHSVSDPRVREGRRIGFEVAGRRLEVSAGSFVQANAFLIEALARAVAEAAGSGRHVLELHAGVGLFTLALAQTFERVTAIESNPTAARDLARNLRHAQLGNVAVVRGRAEVALGRAEFGEERPDAALVDPPRSGLPPELRARLHELRPSRLVYVSCDPATLARDAGDLARRGWHLAAVTGFDLFPQTPHVEALALLEPPAA